MLHDIPVKEIEGKDLRKYSMRYSSPTPIRQNSQRRIRKVECNRLRLLSGSCRRRREVTRLTGFGGPEGFRWLVGSRGSLLVLQLDSVGGFLYGGNLSVREYRLGSIRGLH